MVYDIWYTINNSQQPSRFGEFSIWLIRLTPRSEVARRSVFREGIQQNAPHPNNNKKRPGLNLAFDDKGRN
jgi:hypothetical protein